MEKYLECAAVSGTHGVAGMIKLKSFADSPEALAAVKTLYTKEKDGTLKEWKVERAFVHKGAVVVKLEGLDDMNRAIAMKGTAFFADRDSFTLGEGDFFVADVIGLPVVDEESGERIGTLADLITDRVQHLYVVKKDDGSEFMIPGVGEFIKKQITEGDGAGVYVRLIEGMGE